MRQRHQHGGKEDPVPRAGSYAAIEAYPYCTCQCTTLVQLTSIRIRGHCKLERAVSIFGHCRRLLGLRPHLVAAAARTPTARGRGSWASACTCTEARSSRQVSGKAEVQLCAGLPHRSLLSASGGIARRECRHLATCVRWRGACVVPESRRAPRPRAAQAGPVIWDVL